MSHRRNGARRNRRQSERAGFWQRLLSWRNCGVAQELGLSLQTNRRSRLVSAKKRSSKPSPAATVAAVGSLFGDEGSREEYLSLVAELLEHDQSLLRRQQPEHRRLRVRPERSGSTRWKRRIPIGWLRTHRRAASDTAAVELCQGRTGGGDAVARQHLFGRRSARLFGRVQRGLHGAGEGGLPSLSSSPRSTASASSLPTKQACSLSGRRAATDLSAKT